MRADRRRVGGVHLLVVVARAAVVAALQRRVEEAVAVGLGAVAARAAVDAAVVPALLQRAARAAALAHVHGRRSDLTNHASLFTHAL